MVPEDVYPGPDGFFRCSERNFDELASAVAPRVVLERGPSPGLAWLAAGASMSMSASDYRRTRNVLLEPIARLYARFVTWTIAHPRLTLAVGLSGILA